MVIDRPNGGVQSDEHEVDYRFLLANERTFLAWIRTALGIIAGGVALDQFVTVKNDPGAIAPLAVLVILLGAATALTGTIRWARTDRLMRSHSPMGRSRGVVLFGVSVTAITVVIGILIARL